MTNNERLIWAIAIVIIDFLTIGIPLAALAAAYVLIARPVWFKNWVEKIYSA